MAIGMGTTIGIGMVGTTRKPLQKKNVAVG